MKTETKLPQAALTHPITNPSLTHRSSTWPPHPQSSRRWRCSPSPSPPSSPRWPHPECQWSEHHSPAGHTNYLSTCTALWEQHVRTMNFMFPVPEASVPAVEICSDRSVAGITRWNKKGGKRWTFPCRTVLSKLQTFLGEGYAIVLKEDNLQAIPNLGIIVHDCNHEAKLVLALRERSSAHSPSAMEVMSLMIFLAVWYPGAALPPTMMVLATNAFFGSAFIPAHHTADYIMRPSRRGFPFENGDFPLTYGCREWSCAGRSAAAACTRESASRGHRTWSLGWSWHREYPQETPQTSSCSPNEAKRKKKCKK